MTYAKSRSPVVSLQEDLFWLRDDLWDKSVMPATFSLQEDIFLGLKITYAKSRSSVVSLQEDLFWLRDDLWDKSVMPATFSLQEDIFWDLR